MATVLIIGGGVSGLSAGIYAQMRGHHAIVCERHTVAGGNLTGWQRGEFHIDNCIHWLTGTNPASRTYRRWEDLGALGDGVEILQGESLYTCAFGGQEISLWRDLRRVERQMLAVSPADKREIRSLIRAVEVMQGLCHVAGERHSRGLLSSPRLILSSPLLVRYFHMTAGELAKQFQHPLLRSFISAFWGDDFGCLALLMVFATFCGENGGIPRGGSRAMAERMAARLETLGGELRLGCEAVKIHCEKGRASAVSFADGSVIAADYVVFTADPAVAFERLLGVSMPKQIEKMYHDPRLARFSSFQCAFSCDMEEVPFEGDYIFDTPRDAVETLGSKRVIVRSFGHETSFSPRGKSLLQTLTFCDETTSREFIEFRERNLAAYSKRKREIAALLERLIAEAFPQMKGKLQCIDVWTPATYRRFTDAEIGSYMSFLLPAGVLPRRKSARVRGISNLLLATQWQQIPGGLPIAAEGGYRAVEEICRMERYAKRSREGVLEDAHLAGDTKSI